MYQGTNPAALRSREQILEAFFKLLAERSIEKISIKEVMAETQLARQTFYQIFNSKEEICRYYLEHLGHLFVQSLPQAQQLDDSTFVKAFFHFFAQHQERIKLALENGQTASLQKILLQYLLHLPHFTAQGDAKSYQRLFFISGMIGVLEHWILQAAEKPSIDALVEMICGVHFSHTNNI